MPPVPKSLRIALVSLHTSPTAVPGAGDAGGMNVVVRQQAAVLAARGHEVEILTRRTSSDASILTELAPGLTLRRLNAGPPEPVAKGEHERFIAAFHEQLKSLGPYDIIHSHHWFSGMAALPVARATQVPHVQSFHSIAAEVGASLSAGERPESPGRLAGEAWLARESDAVVTVSRAESHTVCARLGGAAERTWVVPPGVNSTLFHPKAQVHPRAPAHPTPRAQELGRSELPRVEPGRDQEDSHGFVVAAGRVHPLKGFDLAIEAIAAVPAELRPQLVIAGQSSEDLTGYTAELKALTSRLGVSRIVHFIGPQSREDLAALFREAQLVLVPSHSETYGLVALEAAASGVPVVAAASGGLSEAVVDGVTGVVLPSRDPKVWAEAISELLSNTDQTKLLSDAARRRAEHHSWSRSADALIKVYTAVLDRADRSTIHTGTRRTS